MKEDKTREQALNFIKNNKKLLLQTFANDQIASSESDPISIFMAGSPGAGKTEFSRNLIKNNGLQIVRIDADDIRNIIPQYTGNNSQQVQGASALGVEYLHDYILKKGKSMILDATFSDYKKCKLNIQRSLKRKRIVEIYYIYQAPLVAWSFTQAREGKEGRKVPKTTFIKAFFNAYRNVQKVKDEFGDQVQLNVIKKNYQQKTERAWLNISSIDKHINIPYTKQALTKKL